MEHIIIMQSYDVEDLMCAVADVEQGDIDSQTVDVLSRIAADISGQCEALLK